MTDQTEELFNRLIEISKDITALSNIQKLLDDRNNIDESILILDNKTNIITHKMNSYLKLKNHLGILDVLRQGINTDLYASMNIYASYEKALQISHPELQLYQVINTYTEYINNSNAIADIIQCTRKKLPINIKVNTELSYDKEDYEGAITSREFRFSRVQDQSTLINYLTIVVQSSDAYLDDIAQDIVSNYNKIDEDITNDNTTVEEIVEGTEEVIVE